jgi:hypothetical protein
VTCFDCYADNKNGEPLSLVPGAVYYTKKSGGCPLFARIRIKTAYRTNKILTWKRC